jgi:hypothetical protein
MSSRQEPCVRLCCVIVDGYLQNLSLDLRSMTQLQIPAHHLRVAQLIRSESRASERLGNSSEHSLDLGVNNKHRIHTTHVILYNLPLGPIIYFQYLPEHVAKQSTTELFPST